MYKLNVVPNFKKKYLFFIKEDQVLKKRIDKALRYLSLDPLISSLNSHKVETKNYGRKWASWVTGDIRIIWDYSENEINVLDILDLGGHSGKNKLYK